MRDHLCNLLVIPIWLLTAKSVVSQTFKGTINWKEPKLQDMGYGKLSPDFEDENWRLENPGIPIYCNDQPWQGSDDVKLSFSSISYIGPQSSELAAIKSMKLSSEPEIETRVISYKGKRIINYCFYPYVNQNGIIKKISTYSLNAEQSTSENTPIKAKSSIASSVLASGRWHKLSVQETGMYKITPDFLKNNSVSDGNPSVSSIRIVGNGIGMLSEDNDEDRPDDLIDVQLKIYDKNSDGIFNDNDYLLFFARGPHVWEYDGNRDHFKHMINTYRTSNFYFISTNAGSGQSVPSQPFSSIPNIKVDAFDDYDFVEDETNNLVGIGRQWVGDVFDFTLSYNYSFSFPDISSSSPALFRSNVVGRASQANTFMVCTYGGTNILTNTIPAYDPHSIYGDFVERSDESTNRLFPLSDNITITLTYNNAANPAAIAWLDFLEIQVRRNLVYRNKELTFRDQSSVGSGNVAQFNISKVPLDLEVWDVTQHNNVFGVSGSINGGVFSFTASADDLREYVAFSSLNFPEPAYVSSVENQNLHRMNPAEMVIIAHSKFLSEAEKLAKFHINNDNISVEVVSIEEVYNEFSSGGQDITAIRDFAKMLYDKPNGEQFKYLLLFGDASYDYKDRLSNNNNYVPIWESEASFSFGVSSITDDYFGYLDDNEGADLVGVEMDIAIGRIPCESVYQAEKYVDKIIQYASGNNRFGDWRNKVLLMADDMDESWERIFVEDSEELEIKINKASECFNVEKIYTDAYQQVSTSGGESYPEAHSEMFLKIQQGNLITNYIGHGGEIGLSSEHLVQLSDVNGWTNLENMPLFITITCEFSRLDDPKRVSAGEQLLLNPEGGAIALISTTRVVGGGPAIRLNKSIFDILLSRPDNRPLTLGEIVRDAKNKVKNDATKLKFSLLGDPALRLAIPYYRVKTNTINGVDVNSPNLDTLKALGKVVVTGQVNDLKNQKMTDFNGVVNVSVFDKGTTKSTLDNDGIGLRLNFNQQNSLIYRGKSKVRDGDFSFEFRVPKDISYTFGKGKISYYASDRKIDAAGCDRSAYVGGLDDNALIDNQGPAIELYMNDESFVRGGITDEKPEIYAIISDSSGVNTVGSGIGHDLVATLSHGENSESYVVNEYYEADLDNYKRGKVRYPLFSLSSGKHKVNLRVFDTYNNFNEAKTDFIVEETSELALKRVLNYPNPFTNNTEFQFEHNRANQPLEVQIQIFTISGKLVKTINQSINTTGYRASGISWNGLDDYGDKIGKGVYVYRVKIRSTLDNSQADQYEKLVILR